MIQKHINFGKIFINVSTVNAFSRLKTRNIKFN